MLQKGKVPMTTNEQLIALTDEQETELGMSFEEWSAEQSTLETEMIAESREACGELLTFLELLQS